VPGKKKRKFGDKKRERKQVGRRELAKIRADKEGSELSSREAEGPSRGRKVGTGRSAAEREKATT